MKRSASGPMSRRPQSSTRRQRRSRPSDRSAHYAWLNCRSPGTTATCGAVVRGSKERAECRLGGEERRCARQVTRAVTSDYPPDLTSVRRQSSLPLRAKSDSAPGRGSTTARSDSRSGRRAPIRRASQSPNLLRTRSYAEFERLSRLRNLGERVGVVGKRQGRSSRPPCVRGRIGPGHLLLVGECRRAVLRAASQAAPSFGATRAADRS
jgi:hypothetical protein